MYRNLRNSTESDTLEGVYSKYGGYVAPKKNETRSTVAFNKRKQETGERFDSFVPDLRLLVKDCGYNWWESRAARCDIASFTESRRQREMPWQGRCTNNGEGD